MAKITLQEFEDWVIAQLKEANEKKLECRTITFVHTLEALQEFEKVKENE